MWLLKVNDISPTPSRDMVGQEQLFAHSAHSGVSELGDETVSLLRDMSRCLVPSLLSVKFAFDAVLE